jgi:hypothetical protein
MTRFSRAFQPEDWVQINELYKRITGAERSAEEYDWEWRKTWTGQASIWLEFDDSRDPSDQVIAQYGLIPTPMSFWGEEVPGAKTENCMSHPDFRGKGMYFFHEKKYFEVAQKLYEVFFTTAGHVARGAPGKVREKLGYRPFGHWVSYSHWLDLSAFSAEIISKLPKAFRARPWLGKLFSLLLASILMVLARPRRIQKQHVFQSSTDAEAPFSQMADLWDRSARQYGVTIQRTRSYLEWRLKGNPYIDHNYVLMWDKDELQGYLVYAVQDGVCHIVDMIVAGADSALGAALLNRMIQEGKARSFRQIKMSTSWKNDRLLRMLEGANFKNYRDLFSSAASKRKTMRTELFVYISAAQQQNEAVWDEREWYITDLMKEGRPYTARLIQ